MAVETEVAVEIAFVAVQIVVENLLACQLVAVKFEGAIAV